MGYPQATEAVRLPAVPNSVADLVNIVENVEASARTLIERVRSVSRETLPPGASGAKALKEVSSACQLSGQIGELNDRLRSVNVMLGDAIDRIEL